MSRPTTAADPTPSAAAIALPCRGHAAAGRGEARRSGDRVARDGGGEGDAGRVEDVAADAGDVGLLAAAVLRLGPQRARVHHLHVHEMDEEGGREGEDEQRGRSRAGGARRGACVASLPLRARPGPASRHATRACGGRRQPGPACRQRVSSASGTAPVEPPVARDRSRAEHPARAGEVGGHVLRDHAERRRARGEVLRGGERLELLRPHDLLAGTAPWSAPAATAGGRRRRRCRSRAAAARRARSRLRRRSPRRRGPSAGRTAAGPRPVQRPAPVPARAAPSGRSACGQGRTRVQSSSTVPQLFGTPMPPVMGGVPAITRSPERVPPTGAARMRLSDSSRPPQDPPRVLPGSACGRSGPTPPARPAVPVGRSRPCGR